MIGHLLRAIGPRALFLEVEFNTILVSMNFLAYIMKIYYKSVKFDKFGSSDPHRSVDVALIDCKGFDIFWW